MAKKVAFASSDGRFVDLHFGHTDVFYIYELFEDTSKFVEERRVERIAGHSENEFERIHTLLSDCEAIFVFKIGYAAAKYLFVKGIRIFESPYAVKDIINKLVEEKILLQQTN